MKTQRREALADWFDRQKKMFQARRKRILSELKTYL
jgi:hypothetical protein